MGVDDRRTAAWLFLVVAVAYAFFYNGGGWNQNATFDLTRAIAEQGRLSIDRYAGNTMDVSPGRHWHTFINKPPGASLLGVVPYAIAIAVEQVLHVPLDSTFTTTLNLYLLTFVVCGLSGAGIAALLFLYARRIGASRRAAVAVALIMAFGTYLFAYSSVYFAHVPSAFFLLLAFYWLDRRPLLAGAAAGLASLCAYLCILVTAIFAIALLVRSRRAAVRFVAGGLPFAFFLCLYHEVCFGSPWKTSLEESGLFTQKDALLGVFVRPDPLVLWEITCGRYRGLFYISPVLIFALGGAIVMLRRRVMLRELAIVGGVLFVFVISTMSFNAWHGGSAIGPRYILPAVPFLAIPMLFATALFRPLWYALGALSILLNFMIVAVDVMPPAELHDPIGDSIGPHFVRGELSINTEAADEGGPASPGVSPLESTWAAFNLGELAFGAGRLVAVLPIVLWILAGSAILLKEK